MGPAKQGPPAAGAPDVPYLEKMLSQKLTVSWQQKRFSTSFASRYRGRLLARGTAGRLLLRTRLAPTAPWRIMHRHFIPSSRLEWIARISRSKTSQNLICETNTVGVELLAVNKWSCVFAARIVPNECCRAILSRLSNLAWWIPIFSLQLIKSRPWEGGKCCTRTQPHYDNSARLQPELGAIVSTRHAAKSIRSARL